MSIELDQIEEQKSAEFYEMPKTEVTLRIREGKLEESQDGNSFIIKWEMEGAAPAQVLDKAGVLQDFANLPWNPWWYLPKSGKNQAGKNHGGWARLTTLAKKLNISLAGISTDSLTQEFVDKFAKRAFVAADFSGERKVKMKGGQPVMKEDGSGEPQTFVEYNFWQVKDSASRYNG